MSQPRNHQDRAHPTGQQRKPGSAEPQLGESLHRGYYSRKYIPHWDKPGLYQFITYRLSDSVPETILRQWLQEFEALPKAQRLKESRKRIERFLDTGHGSCLLREAEIATCVIETWKKFDTVRYSLLEWVVMPNHVHVLIKTNEGHPIGKIVQSWKSYTARRIQQTLIRTHRPRLDPVWMREYWDRYIRDENHFETATQYIHYNPVKAGLASKPEDWPWCSAAKQ